LEQLVTGIINRLYGTM